MLKSVNVGRILRIQFENARGVVQHNSQVPAAALLVAEPQTSTAHQSQLNSADIPSSALLGSADDLESDGSLIGSNDIDLSHFQSVPLRNTQRSQGNPDQDDDLNQQLDIDLGGDINSEDDRSARALYDDIKSLQRSILRLANESLESAASAATTASRDRGHRSTSHSGDDENEPSNVPGREGNQSVWKPYQSPMSDKPTRGLNLTELRQRNQILIEDTCGEFHYISISVASTWEVSGNKTHLSSPPFSD